jgi:hypothetical protein
MLLETWDSHQSNGSEVVVTSRAVMVQRRKCSNLYLGEPGILSHHTISVKLSGIITIVLSLLIFSRYLFTFFCVAGTGLD